MAHITRSRPVGVLTPGADLLTPLEQFLNHVMPANAHEVATDRLFVSVTESESKQNEIVSTYDSRQELIQVSSVAVNLLTSVSETSASRCHCVCAKSLEKWLLLLLFQTDVDES